MAAQDNLVYAVATEDMDALTFGAPRLIRHLTASQNATQQPAEFELSKILAVSAAFVCMKGAGEAGEEVWEERWWDRIGRLSAHPWHACSLSFIARVST